MFLKLIWSLAQSWYYSASSWASKIGLLGRFCPSSSGRSNPIPAVITTNIRPNSRIVPAGNFSGWLR
ncbi:hypothetical protein LBFF_1119 [Limosilactobacillus fermentum F-6]|nr:hypothetical protein LBFF_1119 [Limosilactobacillus fermentum F-6]